MRRMRSLFVGDIVSRVLLPLLLILLAFVLLECRTSSYLPSADSDSNLSIRGDVNTLPQTGLAGLLQFFLYLISSLLPLVDI